MLEQPDIYARLAVLTAGLFSGAAIFISLGEHPARMACGTKLASTVFPGSFKRAAIIQSIFQLLSTLFSVLAWLNGSDIEWLYYGLLFLTLMPYTFFILMPINYKLLADDLDRESPKTKALLE